MRKDTTFSEYKLSTEEFSKKYWKNGQMPYQYHTASVEDGRDEREQFVFNNIRALYDLIRWHSKLSRETSREMVNTHRKEILKNNKKIAILAVTNMAISTILIIILLFK